MNKNEKFYLMAAGTLLPAFAGFEVYTLVTKREVDRNAILIFAALSLAGGYFTAKMLKGK